MLKRRYFDASKTTCSGDGQIWPNYWAIKILIQLATMKNLSATRLCFRFSTIVSHQNPWQTVSMSKKLMLQKISIFPIFEIFFGKPNMHESSLGHPYFMFFVEGKVSFGEINKILQSKCQVKDHDHPLSIHAHF